MSHIRHLPVLLALACAHLLTGQDAARAQEPGTPAASACQLATAGAGVAAPCDEAAAFVLNPAAVAGAATGMSAGYVGAFLDMGFVRDFTGVGIDQSHGPMSMPSLFATLRLGTVSLAAGTWSPFVARTDWPLAFEGRFIAYRSGLSARYVHAGAATEIFDGRVRLGAAGIRASADLILDRRLDLANELVSAVNSPLPEQVGTLALFGIPQNTDYADNRIRADGGAWSFQAGMTVRATDRLTAGVAYLHSTPIPMRGGAEFEFMPTGIVIPPNNPLFMPAGTRVDTVLVRQFEEDSVRADQDVATGVTLPSRLTVGAAYATRAGVELVLDYEYTDWSANDSLQVSFRFTASEMIPLEYGASHAVRFAARYPLGPWTASAGVHLATPFVPDRAVSPLLADATVAALAAGIGRRLAPTLRFDAAYRFARAADRRGRVRPRVRTTNETDLSEGIFTANSHTLALGVRWTPGGGGRRP